MAEDEKFADMEELIRFQEENPDWWGDKDDDYPFFADYVVDLDRLRENLKLTPAERIERHEARRQAAIKAEFQS